MNVREAIVTFLREQADHTNVIEGLWLLYANATKIPMRGTQWVESRRCFFVGALTLFEAVMMILEPGAEPTDADVARVEQIANELTRFADDLKIGLG